MASTAQPIKIAILAMGGEGGGVLADWIVELGESNGFLAQTTSVPGVAQRTGATLFYVELFPAAAAAAAGKAPVLALMPMPGDVDIVLASELMEAGRAVQRGLVTPERTTFIASTHRVYAISEKVAMGDGRASSATLLAQAQAAAGRFVGYDMAAAAEAHGSVISAVLFGALAGTGVLPFERKQFEATIAHGGVGIQASLAAFGAAHERVARGADEVAPGSAHGSAHGPAHGSAHRSAHRSARAEALESSQALPPLPQSPHPAVQALIERAAREHAGATLAIVVEGLRRLVDYQGPGYAALYLDRLATISALEREPPGAVAPPASPLITEVARHLALWMSYEDTIRVADLKTRGSRFERVYAEVHADAGQIVAINEYLHPRLQEVAQTLPAALGRWLLAPGALQRWVGQRFARGRVVRTSGLRGYLMLSLIASLKRWRPRSLRFAQETQRIDAWLADIAAAATDTARAGPERLALATEIARCQRLIKGYGQTHERGLRHYALLRSAWASGGMGAPGRRALSPATLAELREAALADEHGKALQVALARLARLAPEGAPAR